MKKQYLTRLLICLISLPISVFAQKTAAPPDRTKAPCSAYGTIPSLAIPVCGTTVFFQDQVTNCTGPNVAQPDCTDLFTSGHSFWYKFKCFQAGTLGFLIKPRQLSDDYDWVLFDVTGHNPDDVFTDPTLEISINGCFPPGATGSNATGTLRVNCFSSSNNFNKMPDLLLDHNYLLMVTNFTNSGFGYDLSFGGGTAVISDGTLPLVSNVDGGCSVVKVSFSTDIKCNSVTATGSELSISPGSHPISSVTSVCPLGFLTITDLTINLATPLPPGNYTLTINNGSDGNTYNNICDNQMAVGTTFNFTVLQPKSGFTYTPVVCTGNTASFTSTSDPLAGNTITQWRWEFGDGGTSTLPAPTHNYALPGTYTVKHWIVNSKGCNSDTTLHDIVIDPLPTVNFTNTGPYCVTKDITFTDGSVPNVGIITNWHWDMGDGNIFDLPNGNPFVHTYATTGNKTVTLTVTTDKGCVNTLSKIITINPLPVPSFTYSAACLPYGITSFSNTSTIADVTAMSYTWDFGDLPSGANNTSTLIDPTHLYNTTGPYTVTLTATSSNSCITVTTQVVSDIYPQPHSLFTVAPENCLNTTTSFTSNADGVGNTITEYHWDFGDATTSTAQNPTHTYATAGTKTIKHWIVTDKNCYSDTTIKTVYINRLPSPDFGFTSPDCETRTITFSDASIANDGIVNGWQWDFGDPSSGPDNTSALQNPSHVFATAGTYNVSLSVSTDKGCISVPVKIIPITIHNRPQAGFIIPEVCLNDTWAQFTDTSKIAAGSITNWDWDFGDPGSGPLNTSNLQHPTHSYTAVGPYTVRLIVTSNNGCKDTIPQTIFVNGSFPVADFSVANPGSLCANDSVAITNLSTVFPGTITRVEINWDDVGTPGVFDADDFPTSGKIYKHLYPDFQTPLTKNFDIRLRAYSGGVCLNEKVQTILVHASPKVQFNLIPDTCLLVAPFQITQATETGGVPGTFIFTGTGVSPTGMFNPAVAGIGTHTIKFTYTSSAGCVDTMSRTIRVLDTATAKFSFTAPPVCDGDPVTFTDLSTAPAGVVLANTVWDMGDGSPIQNHPPGSSFNYIYSPSGTYTVTMYNVSAYGCNSTATSRQVTISPLPLTSFTFNETSVCLPDARVSFKNNSTISDGTENTFTYEWNFGDPASGTLNTSSAKTPPPHLYTGTGPYTVTLSVTSGAGCTKVFSRVIDFIHPQPRANFIMNKPSLCLADSMVLTDITDPLDGSTLSWHWDLGDGSSGSTQIINHTYADTGVFTVSLYIINSHNCHSDTTSRSFIVYPYPVVDAGPDREILQGGYVKMQPVVSGNDLQFLWTPNLYFINNINTILAPSAQYLTDDITYTLTVTGRGGCPKSDNVFIKILKEPRIPNTFTPNGDGINEKWDIQYLKDYSSALVQVFTRTGQKVFESRGFYQAWDGRRNGKLLPFDTYYYIIETGNGRDPITGYVTIIK